MRHHIFSHVSSFIPKSLKKIQMTQMTTLFGSVFFDKLGSFAVWTICDDFCFGPRNMLKTSSDDHYC